MRVEFRIFAAAAMLGFAVGAVHAQPATGPTLGTPVGSAEPVALPPDKQEFIKRHVAHSDLPKAELSEPARVGMVIPPDVPLLTLPQDGRTVTPTVTSYSYVIAGDVIAIVQPEERKIIQLIKR
jgi:hypothetical protein